MLTLKRVLLPTDGSVCSREAMKYALSLAQQYVAAITVLHVGRHYWEQMSQAPSGVEDGADIATRIQREQSSEEQRILQEVVDAAHALHVPVEARAVQGSPAQVIIQMAKEISADMVVMGTHGRTGISHAVLGSVAEKVVQRAPCPVLVVRQAAHEVVCP